MPRKKTLADKIIYNGVIIDKPFLSTMVTPQQPFLSIAVWRDPLVDKGYLWLFNCDSKKSL
jgi:hypothetical protein